MSQHDFLVPIVLGLVTAVSGCVLQDSLLKRLSKNDSGLSVLSACAAAVAYLCAVAFMVLISAILANVYEFSVRPLYQHQIVRLPEAQFTIQALVANRTWSMPGDKVVTVLTLYSMGKGACLPSVVTLVLPQIVCRNSSAAY